MGQKIMEKVSGILMEHGEREENAAQGGKMGPGGDAQPMVTIWGVVLKPEEIKS